MQETVASSSGETKSLFLAYLEVEEVREAQALLKRQLAEERCLRRTQRIYEFHERQRREAAELRRCLEYVSQHAHALETVLREAAAGAEATGEESVPLGAALVRQASALQRCMAQCVSNAAQIRALLSAAHRDQMDALLTKMERELQAWTLFVQRAHDATSSSESIFENLYNLIAEQRRCVREVSTSGVFRALAANSPSANSPSANTPSPDTPSANSPPANSPSANSPPANSPSANTPSVNSYSANTPSPDTPSANTPSVNTPSANTPSPDTPSANTPSPDTPSSSTSPTACSTPIARD